jgi:hypothetical protein
MAGAVLVSTFSVRPWADTCNPWDWEEVGAPPHWQPIPLRSIDCQCGGSMGCADFYRQIFTPPDTRLFSPSFGQKASSFASYGQLCNQPICHPIWFAIFGISSLIPKSETK